MEQQKAAEFLMDSSVAMHESAMPLMHRIVPDDVLIWNHYPEIDVVNGVAGSRFFYHCHPPEDRDGEEHGHFHFFIDKKSMDSDFNPLIAAPEITGKRAEVVHIAALSMDYNGLPIKWFTTNRWVTDESLYPAENIISKMALFDLRGLNGDPLVNIWLTAMLRLSQNIIANLLRERDEILMQKDPSGEDRNVEILSHARVDLSSLLDG
ncbi:hypothetical protein LPB140_09085 [Sphingorhabdus lutea]|uniref:DUF6969 domain-containing protein n=2 Tax=Sphingorhabdus lutea TaxID=1913578 RepID=A0A1L3JF60_9SPHN|nr:hypothetical protein LPB140_09085 [Sphingorhabdus lutea]